MIQPVEVYSARRDGGRCVPILYSLGNLVTLEPYPHARLSLLTRLTLARDDSANGRIRPTTLHITPVLLSRGILPGGGGYCELNPLADVLEDSHPLEAPGRLRRIGRYCRLGCPGEIG